MVVPEKSLLLGTYCQCCQMSIKYYVQCENNSLYIVLCVNVSACHVSIVSTWLSICRLSMCLLSACHVSIVIYCLLSDVCLSMPLFVNVSLWLKLHRLTVIVGVDVIVEGLGVFSVYNVLCCLWLLLLMMLALKIFNRLYFLSKALCFFSWKLLMACMFCYIFVLWIFPFIFIKIRTLFKNVSLP